MSTEPFAISSRLYMLKIILVANGNKSDTHVNSFNGEKTVNGQKNVGLFIQVDYYSLKEKRRKLYKLGEEGEWSEEEVNP